MAIRLNLYHQVLRAKREKQYDPLKISFLSLLVVALGLATYYFIQLRRTNVAQATHAARKAEFENLSPLAKTAQEREVALTKQIELADRLTQRIEKRFYWAPVFESLVTAVPPNVQITKLSGDIKNGEPSRNCQLLLEGLAAGQEPRASAEELRRAVVERLAAKYPTASATFRNLDDSAEQVRMDGKVLATAVFTIQISFKAESGEVLVDKPLIERHHRPLAQRN
jgi:Tfp pilus assembly protein PilN